MSQVIDFDPLACFSVRMQHFLLRALLPAILSLSALVQAASPGVVRFATSTVKPWGYLDSESREQGLLVSFARELSAEAGVPYRNYLQPYPRVIHSLKSGFVDFAVLFDSPLARQAGIRVGSVVMTEVMVVGAGKQEPLNSIENLAGLRVGYIRGSKYGAAFDNAAHFERVPINAMHQGVAMVIQGRLDAMASADQTLYHALTAMAVKPGQISRLLTLSQTSGGLYMSRTSSHRDLLPVYKEALGRMENSGALASIFYHPSVLFTAGQLNNAPLDGDSSNTDLQQRNN